MASEKTTQILDLIKGLTILELSDLVKAVEEEFGVSATPVAVAGVAAAAAPAAEEKTEFDVILANFGAKPETQAEKIQSLAKGADYPRCSFCSWVSRYFCYVSAEPRRYFRL